MNIFIPKAPFVKKTASDQPFDFSMDSSNNARKVVISIKKTTSSLNRSLEKHFDQTDYVPYKLILLIGLITENKT